MMAQLPPSIANLRLPNEYDDLGTPFSIDGEIRSLLSARGRQIGIAPYLAGADPSRLLLVGRDILRVAFNAATAEHNERRLGDHIEEWRRVAERAEKAKIALRALLDVMGPVTGGSDDPTVFAMPLRRPILDARPDIPLVELTAEAQEQAETLVQSMNIIDTFANHTAAMRRQLASGRTNPGEVEKAAFVSWIARGWTFLTGRVPGRHLAPEGNPFVGFAAIAWTDLGGDASSFDAAIARLDRDKLHQEAEHMRGRWERGHDPF